MAGTTKEVDLRKLVKMNYGCGSVHDLVSQVSSFLSELKKPDKDPNKPTDTDQIDKVKEKCRIKERLVFFNTLYREMSEPTNNVRYLSAMSDLLAIYIDLEVTTCAESLVHEKKKKSSRGDYIQKKIEALMSKIVTSLFTMLDKSEDHILDTVLKLKPPSGENPSNEIYHEIHASIYRYIVKRAANCQINDLTYMRYVLIYKLWSIMLKETEKEAAIKQAAMRLRPPPGFRERWRTFPKILPKPSKEMKNITEFYLKKPYDVCKSVKMLLKTSYFTLQSSMFPNIRCKPQLMNPLSRATREPEEPTKRVDIRRVPVEEISTPQRMADDLWTRLCCEEPLSESSLYNQVINFKQPHKLTVTKLYKILNRHKVQVKKKVSKKTPKKNILPIVKASKQGVYVNGGISPRDKVEAVLQVAPETKSRKTTKNGERNNRKRHRGSMPELPVLKDIKISPPPLKMVKIEYWEPASQVPVHSSYDKTVSPYRGVGKCLESKMAPPAVSPSGKELKLSMVDASVSTVDDFDWTMNFLKQDQSWQQSCSAFSEKQPNHLMDKGVQSVFDKPTNHPVSQAEDLLRGSVQGCLPAQKKDQAKVNLDGCAGMMDTQFAPDLAGFDLDEPMWGPLDEPGQYSVDPMTLLRELFNDCPDVLSTPSHPGPESHDIWVKTSLEKKNP